MGSGLVRGVVLVALFSGVFAACVPTASRKNARLEHGFDFDLTAGMQYVLPGENDQGTSTSTEQVLHVETDFQYAHKYEDGSGLAAQIKVPLNIVFTSLDFYYQLPETNSKWFFGFGAEVGALPGVYAVVTHYLDDSLYISLTPRVLNAQERGKQAVLINPQLSMGIAGGADFSLFASFAHHTGDGFDFDIELFADERDRHDYRTDFWLLGGSVRF